MVTMSIAFIAGSYFTLSQVLLPMIRALTETTTQMPSEVAFNRLAESGLAGHDTGGGATFVLSGEVKLATSSAWWTADYAQKKQLTVRNLSSVPLATQSATTQQITINTKELYDAGKLQTNCEDLRVVFVATQSANMRTELPRSFYPASGATDCSDSTATTVAFPLQEPLWAGGSDSNYEVYYGNSSATDPGYLDQGYSITRADNSTASATLVCPFNGTTTCVGGETPTTQTGAIRYSGGSAMSFDGKDDYIRGPVPTTVVDNWTIEAWIYLNTTTGKQKIIEIGEDPGGGGICTGYSLNVENGYLQVGYPCVMANTGIVSVSAGVWTHVVAVRNNGKVSLFKDGTLAQENISTITPSTPSTYYGVGNDRQGGLTAYFNGLIDEVRVSDIARYTSNFTPQTTPFEPDEYTKLLLHFDENGDDPRNTGKAIDSSGNGNHGTITGAKYVSGLVGVDNSSSSTGAIPASTYSSHQGVFIEEGTTNLITNPSFENASSATLNWGTNYFNYATASATFTPSMAKRNSAGPFAAGPMVQGNLSNSTVTDQINFSRGNRISGYFYQNMDENQGSVVFWITPEWNGNDNQAHYVYYDQNYDFRYIVKGTNNQLTFFYFQKQVSIDVSTWIAGSTYAVVARWDRDNTLDGTNYLALSVNDSHFFGGTSSLGGFDPQTTISLGSSGSSNPANAIIEGLTIYRRPLFDGQYGIDVGNGDEIAQIYNSGTGKDPTLVTGSWDVVFALPTNASTGALTTGTGNAWSHPHASNLLYTSTTNTGGFMMGAHQTADGFQPEGSVVDANSISFVSTGAVNAGSDSSLDNLLSSDVTLEGWSRIVSDATLYNTLAGKTSATGDGWYVRTNTSRLTFNAKYDTTNISITSGTGLITSNTWFHWAVDYSNSTQTATLYVNGQVVGTSTGVGNYVGDSFWDFSLASANTGHNLNGLMGWTRVSNSRRYTASFTPTSRWSSPTTDANTVAQWNMTDGTGTTVTNVGNCGGVASNCNGTLSNGTWNQGGALSTNQKIFSGGYKFTSNAINQGISRSFTATSGGDYVLRALGHSDGTCNPQVKITRADGTTEISHLNGTTTSTRTDPDVYIFTWESPAAEANQVQLINTAASGTCYWHQVEVLTNKINKSSFEGGFSGTPLLPSGWCSGNDCDQGYSPIENGDITEESTIVHSGQSSLRYTSNFTSSGDFLMGSNAATSVGTYYSVGGFSYGNGSVGAKINSNWGARGVLQHTGNTGFLITGGPAQHWSHFSGVMRMNSTWDAIGLLGSGGDNIYADDIYMFVISPVSLTVTPANQANSTETSGLRVDGADTLTQPITGLSADRGVIKFKFTPRHSWSTAASFGISDPHIFSLGSGSNWISLWRVNSSNLRLDSNFNGSYYTPQWTNPVLNAGETYDIEISYAINNAISLKVNGNIIAFQAMGNTPFSVVPTQIYWGGYSSGKQYDGTISNFITLTPTENTTAPYYKFGSKSVKLVNAGTMPDEYTIAIDPNSTATHTLSAYVYDGTTGNVGGTVASSSAKLVFGGNVVTPSAYTDMGGGWWRLSYSAATTDASLLYGVQAQAGKTIYVDGVQLETRPFYHANYWTSFSDGSLGTGYSWSGNVNDSISTRTSGSLSYSTNTNILPSSGTLSFWVKTNTSAYTYSNSGKCFFTTGQNITICTNGAYGGNWSPSFDVFNGTTNYRISFDFPSQGIWTHYIGIWESNNIRFYVNGQSKGTPITTATMPSNLPSTFSLGGALSASTLSDLRIFDSALTPQEVSQLYQQGLATHSSGSEAVDRYQASGTYTSPVIDLSANGAWGTTPWSATNALNGGGINYFTRTSMDNVSWSSWTAVTGSVGEGSWTGGIASDPRRYLQWKADLTSSSDKNQSPVITAMSTTYVEDSTPPANPAQVALGYANHASSSATLTSNNWYNYATPKFTWEAGLDDPAAGQSSSGIDGYHVLLTTDQNASPSANLASPCYRFSESDDRVFSVGTTPAGCSLSDADYYLRMQTKDNSGNVSSPVTLFTYRYDSTPPRSPVSVSSTTVGYTSQNEFSFYWPPASDQGTNQSGLAYYEYKTGATDGPYSTWTKSNQPGDSLVTVASSITAYQEGQNFFFVRTVDFAGNVSAEISNLGVSPFYFNESAPTAPQNLVITPSTTSDNQSPENIFSVTWDKPASYSGELAKYYYCVNCTPSAETMTETTNAQTADRTLTNLALATQQGKNTFYLVAEDNNINTETGRGNVNFEAFATADFYASTIAPGAPTNLTISDASDRDAKVWRLTLAWKAATTGGTPDFYAIHRSTDGTTFTKIGETTSTAYTDADLSQSQTYSYKVFAIDNANSTSLASNTVSLSPEGKYTSPPLAGGTPSVDAGSTIATVSWSTGRVAFGAVEYGKTTSYEQSMAETVAVGNHSVKLTGLTPGTTYHYRVQALDESNLMGYERETAYSADFTFTTSATPTISNVEVTDLSLNSAVINWQAISLTSAQIEYGESTAYGSTLSVGVGSEGSYSTKITGLKDSVTYHFRIRAVDIDGTDITSDDYTFTTVTFPKVTAVVFKTDQAQNATAINVAWSTNVPTTASVEYQAVQIDPAWASQQDTNYSNATVLQGLSQTELARLPVVPLGAPQYLDRSTINNRHVVQIADLSDSSLYVFTIRGRDEYGNQAVSDPIRYVTGADTKPPSVEDLVIETPIVGEGVESKAEIVLSFTTDEPAFSQVLWGAGTGSEYPQSTQTSAEATTDHMIVLRDLNPTSTYHLKIKTTDQTQNSSETEDTVVVTPTAQAAAFELILKNLEGIFGFLGLQ